MLHAYIRHDQLYFLLGAFNIILLTHIINYHVTRYISDTLSKFIYLFIINWSHTGIFTIETWKLYDCRAERIMSLCICTMHMHE